MVEFETLETDYRQLLDRFSQQGSVAKSWYLKTWHVGTGAVWLTLLSAILGLSLTKLEGAFAPPWLDYEIIRRSLLRVMIPFLGTVSAVCIVIQLIGRFELKWRCFRSAAERLQNACMRFNCGLEPYDSDDRSERLHSTLETIQEHASGERMDSWLDVFRELNSAQRPPSGNSLPWQGLTQQTGIEKEEYLNGRLREQRAWFIDKSRRYVLYYLGFQFAILTIGIANPIYVFLVGREFWFVAAITTLSLGLIAWRDFLSYGSLIFRYLETSAQLRALDRLADKLDVEELIDLTEHTLEKEFELWYLQRGGLRDVDSDASPESN